jgi:succinate dehydrogenase / fumarate reductase iron-sulfur subunit
MARNVKLRIWRGDSKDGALKDVTVEANEGEVFAGIVKPVSADHVLWRSTESRG